METAGSTQGEAMSETALYLVRHAHAIWTPDDGRALSPEGLARALSYPACFAAASAVASASAYPIQKLTTSASGSAESRFSPSPLSER